MKQFYPNIFNILCVIALFMASCSNDNDTLSNDNSASTSKRNYVFAIKGGEQETRGTSLNGTTWTTGQTIRIQFMAGGSSYAKQKVEEYAREWLAYANLNFNFVTSGSAEVRIAFNYEDSHVAWSKIGKKCLQGSRVLPTMNLPYYDDLDVNSDEFRAVVLREFGHVLGLVFEHQGPSADGLFDWNEGKVINYFRQQGWSLDEILDLIEEYYRPRETKYTEFDEESIMLLFFPSFLTNNNKETRWNTELSDMDKSFVKELYPGR